jgi:quinol monooxygenase YgiN
MSVLITAKFLGDTAKFRQALADRADDLARFAGLSRSAGAIHHRFGVGDGFVLVVDEWQTAEQFQQFMANPDLQAFIAQMGAAPALPEVTITDAVDSSDQF